MEKEGKLSSFDQRSQSVNHQQNKPKIKQEQSSIYEFDWFPITTSPWIASISFVFQLLFIVHTIDFYADNAGRVFSNTNSLKAISPFISLGMQSIAYTLNTLLSILSILSLIFSKNQQAEGYKYLLGWVGSKVFPVLRYMIDVNLGIAAIFLIRTPIVAVFFVMAALVNIVINFFGQNYTLRKDYLCVKSMEYMLMWKVSVILGYSINCAGYYLIQDKATLVIFLILQLILFATLLVCYFIFGYLIYRHTSSQILILFAINTFSALAMGNLYDTILTLVNGEFVPNRNLMLAGCFFLSLCFLSYCVWTNIKKKGSSLDAKDPIKKIYFLFNKLQNSSENINDDCQIRGIIRYHISHPCNNQGCFINQSQQSYYDSKKNKHCYSNKLNQGKTSFVKFIAKCIYEQEMQNQKTRNTELFLDYIQFYFMKLKNLFKVCSHLVELEKKFLTPFQKIRLTRLRRVMMQENRKLNEQLYNGSLDLQNLITSQNKFDEIQIQLKEVLTKNIQFWRYMQKDAINLSTMVRMLKPNFLLIDKINNNWKSLAKYFQIKKVWKFLFVCYTLYIRNQKIKPQFLQQFGQSVHQDELFNIQSQHIDKTTQTSKLYISKMIFQQDVCCVHINHNQEKPIIKSVSRYFQRIFGYQSNQIIESSLDIMMTPCFRQFHKKKFLKWAGEGKSNKENNYQVKKVFPVNKDGFVVSTFKFYKQFLCLNKQLQYVAMFKKNKQQEHVMILNDNYEIEGMTESLMQKLQLTPKQYHEFIGLNILIFLPGLIEFTKFEEDKENMSEQLIGLINESGRANLTSQFSERSKSKKIGINSKKQFTKNNIALSIPNYVQSIRQAYQSDINRESRKAIFGSICKGYKVFKQIQCQRAFKVEIEVRQIKVQQSSSYLQFYLRQIELADKNDGKSYDGKQVIDKQNLMSYEDNINQEDINKFFENSQNSQNISLAFSDNIFIKEDNNQPVEMISHVKSISLYVRIIFILFFGLLIGSLLFEYNNYDNYRANSQKMKAMVSLQLKTFMLNNKYHSQMLNISGSNQSVAELTVGLRAIRQRSIQFKKSILDNSINQPHLYDLSGSTANNKYDQIDIIDKMFENVIQILYNQDGDASKSMQTYSSFDKIALPYMEQLTTKAMTNISNKVNQIYRMIEIKNYVFVGVGLVLLVVGFLLVLSSLIRITKSFVSLMEIFTQFNQSDLKKIIRYCLFLDQLFSHLNKKYDQFKDNQKITKHREQIKYYEPAQQNSNPSGFKLANGQQSKTQGQKKELDNANLNKKVKKVQNGKQLTNLKLKSIVYVIVFLVLYGISSFGLNLYTAVINKSIYEYKDAGFLIFQYYSSINIYVLAMKDREILKDKFDISRYRVYRDKIGEMKQLKQEETDSLNNDYIITRNQILFENICQLYPSVLQSSKHTLEDCLTVSEDNLRHGIQSYLFYMVHNVDFYLNSTSSTLDMNLAEQLEVGLEISNIFLEFLLEKWSDYFISIMSTLNRNIIIICASLFIFQLIIYIVLIEFLIVGNLKEKFLLFRKIYNNMTPDFIVTKEKIIKAKLEVEGIIKK